MRPRCRQRVHAAAAPTPGQVVAQVDDRSHVALAQEGRGGSPAIAVEMQRLARAGPRHVREATFLGVVASGEDARDEARYVHHRPLEALRAVHARDQHRVRRRRRAPFGPPAIEADGRRGVWVLLGRACERDAESRSEVVGPGVGAGACQPQGLGGGGSRRHLGEARADPDVRATWGAEPPRVHARRCLTGHAPCEGPGRAPWQPGRTRQPPSPRPLARRRRSEETQRQRHPGPGRHDLGMRAQGRRALEPEGHVGAQRSLLEGRRLIEPAQQHGVRRPRQPRTPVCHEAGDDGARLRLGAVGLVERERATRAARRPSADADAIASVGHQCHGRGQRLGARAERVVEHQHPRPVAGGEAAEQTGCGTAEAVDALVVVAHQDDVLATVQHPLQHRELHGVDVLGLVDHGRAPALPGPGTERLVPMQRLPGRDQELVVVEPAELAPDAFEVLEQDRVAGSIGVGGRWSRLGPCRPGQGAGGQTGQLEARQGAAAVGAERGEVDLTPGVGEVGIVGVRLAPGALDHRGHDAVAGRPRPSRGGVHGGRCGCQPSAGGEQPVGPGVERADVDGRGASVLAERRPDRGDGGT